MNVGKTLFAQVMEFVPWKTFGRITERHKDDAGVRTLGCADLFRVMAFAQLTWRESLRDIEACLAANQAKLFHMGLKAPPARSTLADGLNLRDWRIYHALAQRLIARARALYAQEPSVLDLDASVYALDATTIDLCLSLFEWAPFRSTKAAIKLHTLLDLCGAIPAFIHISDGKLHDVNVLDILPVEAGAFYVIDRGYLDFERLYAMHPAAAFVGAADPAAMSSPGVRDADVFLAYEARWLAWNGRAGEAVDRLSAVEKQMRPAVRQGPAGFRIATALVQARLALAQNAEAGAAASALAGTMRVAGATATWTYRTAAELAALAAARSDNAREAGRWLEELDAMPKQPMSPSAVEGAESWMRRAEVYQAGGRPADASVAIKRALALLNRQHAQSPRLAEANRLANSLTSAPG